MNLKAIVISDFSKVAGYRLSMQLCFYVLATKIRNKNKYIIMASIM